jgi:hypothetical protein
MLVFAYLILERAIGIEPTTYSLGSCRSTTELRPHYLNNQTLSQIAVQRFGMFWNENHRRSDSSRFGGQVQGCGDGCGDGWGDGMMHGYESEMRDGKRCEGNDP